MLVCIFNSLSSLDCALRSTASCVLTACRQVASLLKKLRLLYFCMVALWACRSSVISLIFFAVTWSLWFAIMLMLFSRFLAISLGGSARNRRWRWHSTHRRQKQPKKYPTDLTFYPLTELTRVQNSGATMIAYCCLMSIFQACQACYILP